MLNDISQRLKAKTYNKGDVLKKSQESLRNAYFVCSGAIGVLENHVVDQSNNPEHEGICNSHDREELSLVNEYTAG